MNSELLEPGVVQVDNSALIDEANDDANRQAAMLAPPRVSASAELVGLDPDAIRPLWHPGARSRKAAPPAPWNPWRGGASVDPMR
jgi:hypothetical protein